MNIPLFARTLPDLYHDWGLLSVQPRTDKFRELLHRIPGMTTPSIMQVLNHAVSCMAPGEVYCEIGCYHGTTLLGALLDHPYHYAYAADNFSQFDPEDSNQATLLGNIAAQGLASRVHFSKQDSAAFLADLCTPGGLTGDQDIHIGVYFYDGAHDYESELMGLQMVVPLLARQALIVVDDSNNQEVQQAIRAFLALHSECQVLYDVTTPYDGHPGFFYGLTILTWSKLPSKQPIDRLPYLRHYFRPTQVLWDRSYRARLLAALESCQRLTLVGCDLEDAPLLEYLTTFAEVTIMDAARTGVPVVPAPDCDGIIWSQGLEHLEQSAAAALLWRLRRQVPLGIIEINQQECRDHWWLSDFTVIGLDWRHFGPGDYRYYTNYLIGYWDP